jgi:predicted Zn-dependent protease
MSMHGWTLVSGGETGDRGTRQHLRTLALVTSVLAGLLLAARPSYSASQLDQLNRALHKGDLPAAERMVHTILRTYPDCPRAHFAYAEILAQQGKITKARHELTTAERLEPGLSFAPPATVERLVRKLGMSGRFPTAQQAESHF